MRGERLYVKTFIKIALVITVTTSVLSVVLFINFRSANSSLVQDYIGDQLYQIKHSTDMMMENARRTTMSYASNGDVLKLINNVDMDSLELFKTLQRVEALQHNQVQKEYLCFYNQRTNSLFYRSKQYPADDFPDDVLISILRSREALTNFYPVLRKAPDYERLYMGSPADTNMYSFIYTNSPDGQSNNAVVLNIPVENIDTSISIAHSAINREIIILNKELRVIRGNEHFAYNSIIENEPAIASLIRSADTNGYIIDQVDGEKCLISYVESDVANWKYLRITPYHIVTSAVLDVLWKNVIITLVVLLPLMFIGAITSRNIYGVYRRRLSELDQQYQEKKKSGFSVRQRYLRKVLHGEIPLVDSGRETYRLRLNLEGPYTMLLLSINQYASFCRRHPPEDRELYVYGILNVLDEIMVPVGVSESVDLGEGQFAVLISGDTPDLDEAVGHMRETIEAYIEATISTVTSDPILTSEDLPLAVSECREALHYRLYYGGQMQTHIREIREIRGNASNLSDSAIRLLTDTLMLGKEEELRKHCRETLGTMKSFSYADLKVSIMKIIMAVQEVVSHKGFDTDIVRLDEWLGFVQDMSDCPSIDAIESRLDSLFGKVLAGMNAEIKIKDMRFARLFDEVQQILHTEYADPDLTPESIAERLHMSAEYFKKMYKSNTSVALSEAINKYRLDKSSELIEKTNRPIAELARECGFSNVNYFYTLFKRKHAITAAEYRKIRYKDPVAVSEPRKV